MHSKREKAASSATSVDRAVSEDSVITSKKDGQESPETSVATSDRHVQDPSLDSQDESPVSASKSPVSVKRFRLRDDDDLVNGYPQCGKHLRFPPGHLFQCIDLSDENVIKNCTMRGFYNYQCVDPTNGKLEWPNWNESDHTPDNSHLTSWLTDGLLETETDDQANPPVALVMQGNPNDISDIQTSALLSVDYDDDDEDNSDLDVNDYDPGYDGEDGQDGSEIEDQQ